MRMVPRSLFGRLVGVLLTVLVIAQMVTFAIHSQERGELLLRASGAESAQRIADIVRLLQSSDAAGRLQIARLFAQPPLSVSLDRAPMAEARSDGPRAALFATVVRRFLGNDGTVEFVAVEPVKLAIEPLHAPGMMGPGVMHGHFGGPFFGMGGPAAGGLAFVAQVRLHDATLVTFDARPAEPAAGWSLRLLGSLTVLLVAVVSVSLVAVRWVTRPLKLLAQAADDLGRNIERPPMEEAGPTEVVRAARAFNTMQARLVAYVRERTSVLAAMSHDLKTPVTRLRLRAELLPDPDLRRKFTQDLEELEAMVAATLDFLRGAQGVEPVQPIDMASLLDSVQADLSEVGGQVTVSGRPHRPYAGHPAALKRCVRNLAENAVKYGRVAHIEVRDSDQAMEILFRDEGPGLAQEELERVFEPFYRVDASRSRDTGGTGLGLTISRSIAELHGGSLTLRNHPDGGLEARLVLHRNRATT